MGGAVKSVTKFAGKVVKNVLGIEDPQAPQAVQNELANPPAAEPVTPMPTPNDDAVRTAKRKSTAQQRRRGGRSSTILTSLDDSLGG
jgi:hypothetical protein